MAQRISLHIIARCQSTRLQSFHKPLLSILRMFLVNTTLYFEASKVQPFLSILSHVVDEDYFLLVEIFFGT